MRVADSPRSVVALAAVLTCIAGTGLGTATMPAVGYTSIVADHTSMGTGAIVAGGIEPAAFRQALLNPDPNLNGPQLVFVRLRSGVSPQIGLADMQHLADAANNTFAHDPNATGSNVAVLGVQRPAEIVNYRSTGATPLALAAALSAAALLAWHLPSLHQFAAADATWPY